VEFVDLPRKPKSCDILGQPAS